MTKTTTTLFLTFYFYINCFATGDSLNYLRPQDTVFMSVSYFSEKIIEHKLEKKQTLYSLARFYGMKLNELYYYNPALKETYLSEGVTVRIPIPNIAIKRYKHPGFVEEEYAPIYYRVKKGDTMYNICKRYFRMPMDTVMIRNGMEDHILQKEQLLHIGWLNIGGVPDSLRQIRGGPLEKRNQLFRKKYIRESTDKNERTERGAAFWQKKQDSTHDFYALHNQAEVNTVISVTNPMNNRTAYARVIGRIPESAYTNDIIIVISPAVATLLGAKDARFFVNTSFFK